MIVQPLYAAETITIKQMNQKQRSSLGYTQCKKVLKMQRWHIGDRCNSSEQGRKILQLIQSKVLGISIENTMDEKFRIKLTPKITNISRSELCFFMVPL